MEHPPKHHIHETLENIKKECNENPNAPVTNSLMHKIAFLNSKLSQNTIDESKRTELFALLALIAAGLGFIVSVVQLIITFRH